MRYPEWVESSIKGGVRTRLGPRTVLFGGNGTGKTAIVQTIELACRGYVSDMEGRSRVASGQDLARLFPKQGPRTVRVVWSDGSVFAWELADGDKPGSFKRPVGVQPFPVEFPVEGLASVFSQDDAAVRAWMENQVFGSLGLDDVLSAVRGHEAIIKSLYSVVGKADFLGLADEAKSQARSLRMKATRTETTINQLTQGVAVPLTGSERAEIERKIAALKAEEGISQDEADQLASEIGRLTQEHDALEAGSSDTALVKKLLVLRDLVEKHLTHFGSDLCEVCGSKGNIKGRLDKIQQALAASQALVEREEKRQVLKGQISTLATRLKEAKIRPAGAPSTRDLELKLHADTEAKKVWDNAHRTRAQVDQMRALANEYDQTAQLLNDYGRIFVKARKHAFEEKVNQYLAGAEMRLDLDASRVGFHRNGETHTALSGTEEARIFLALGATLGASDAIMIPRDRAWDPVTLTQTMEVLRESKVPVLIMSTVAPVQPVDGWTIVTT